MKKTLIKSTLFFVALFALSSRSTAVAQIVTDRYDDTFRKYSQRFFGPLAQRLRGYRIGNLEFSLVGERSPCRVASHVDGICRVLDDAAFARKMAAAKGYAELAGEVNAMQTRTSTDALKTECLRPVDSSSVDYRGGQLPFYESCGQLPFYESYGEKQVAAGHYDRVIRYHEHIAPLAEALKRYSESSS